MSKLLDRRIIVALDYPEARHALEMAARLDPLRCRVKVGKELFTRSGPELVRQLVRQGFDVFLDLKFHDIPNTVGRACMAAADMGVWMMNVHAQGGRRMLEAARESLTKVNSKSLLIAVTVLTSLEQKDLDELGWNGTIEECVLRLARLTHEAGLDGVVCSPQEVGALRTAHDAKFLLVTPGVRPLGSANADQRRVMSPGDALRAGSSYLVIGRPITEAPDPALALQQIQDELAAGSTR